MTHYKLRISYGRTEIKPEDFLDILFKDCKHFAFVNEGNGVEIEFHTHYYIITDVKEATFRDHLRKQFGSSKNLGNKVFSLKDLEHGNNEIAIEYLAYMYKEGQVVTSGSFWDPYIDIAIDHNKKVQAEIKKVKSSKKSQILQLISHIEEVYSKCEEGFYVNDKREIITKESIIDLIIGFYKENNLLIREFHMISLAQTLCLRFISNYDFILKDRILQKI
jgi:hypothetical protein